MKFINNFNILKSDLQKLQIIRRFTINGTPKAVFDLKITNAAGKFYNFITKTFETNQTFTTTSVVTDDINGSTIYINAANASIKPGMTVTGNGVSSYVFVKSINSQTIILSSDVDIIAGVTLKFSAEAGLNEQKLNNSGSYKDQIVFPTVSGNDVYTVLLEASIANDTELKTTDIIYDLNSESSTYGEDITPGFTNKLFKSITIYQYVDTTITINASSLKLDDLSVDYSANSFTIVRPRGFTNNEGFKTSFSWVFTTTAASAIAKSRTLLDTYFETAETQTVNGTVSSSRTVVMDSVDNIVVGATITGTGLTSAKTTVLTINEDTLTLTMSLAQSIGDGVTLTFTESGSKGPAIYGTSLSFNNLTTTLTPLTVTVASGHSGSAEVIPLVSASYIQDGSTTLVKGVGVDVDETDTNVVTRVGFTEGGCVYNNDPTIAHTADSRIVAGLVVTGAGIPSGATIASITDTTHFELSVSTTGGGVAAGTLTFTSNNITLSAAKTVEAGQTLTIEGSSSAVTITGDVILKSMGNTNFTSTLQIDDFIGIGVS